MFHFYLGDPVEMLQLFPDGNGQLVTLGSDIFNNMHPQINVQREVWQASRLKSGGKFALLGTTMSPGFDFKDYVDGKSSDLVKKYPDFKDYIQKLSKY